MKRILYILAAGIFGLAMSSCVEESFVQYNPENVTAPVLEALGSDPYTLTADGAFATFKFSKASFGINTPVRYTLYMDMAGNDFKSQRSVGSVDSPALELALTGSSINPTLIRMNCTPGKEVKVEFRLMATWKGESAAVGSNGSYDVYSNSISATVIPYYAEREYPKLYVIGSYASNWNFNAALFLYDYAEDDKYYQGVIDFGESRTNLEFKFTDAADWTHGDWGLASGTQEGETISLAAKGGNINLYGEKRYYHFTFDKSALTLKKNASFDAMTLSVNGGDEIQMTYFKETQRFYADANLSGTDAKLTFKTDDGKTYENLETIVSGAAATDGNYRIFFDMNNFDAMSVILDASAYGNGGDEPEPEPTWKMNGQSVANPDWAAVDMTATTNGFAYYLTGVEVSANSQFGFLDPSNVWYALDKTEYASDASITVNTVFNITKDNTINAIIPAAGTYDYWVVPTKNVAYVMETGKIPEAMDDTYGLCGTINGWGDIGDYAMTEENGYHVRKNVNLTENDEIKIRMDNDWAENYGLSDGTFAVDTPLDLASGGDNIKVTQAGTYDIYFDKNNTRLYVMTAGKTPSAE